MDKKETSPEVSFKDTLNLPQTDFPIRAQAEVNDPIMLKRWHDEQLSTAATNVHHGAHKFILHDGPPYANGHIHLGHAYNKILKDIVTKSQRMAGKHVPVVPGWDCHGLPIELKVTQENPGVVGKELKKKCRAYAQQWMQVQREEFKKLGVLMDWEHPYMTMSYAYEASIVQAFGKFYEDGYIERKKKTVPWCPSCQTVLATAEIEYEDRKDPSIYVLFPLTGDAVTKLVPTLAGHEVSLLVWTTTPWTLPLNRAVCLKNNSTYVVIQVQSQDNPSRYVIVGEDLADAVVQLLGVEKKIIAHIPAQQFRNTKVHHPFVDGLKVPVLLEAFVSTDEGTACVHSAPGCGPEDYEIGIRNQLEIFSPISPDGKYMRGIKPEILEGMSVADGNSWVIKTLQEKGKLLHKRSITHSYPHCWRCHGGLIFRATQQWFLDLSRHQLREKSLRAIEDIRFVPTRSSNFLKATVASRLEWCISRQRIWGVGIPALLCDECGHGFTTKKIIETVIEGIRAQGSEFWDGVALAEFGHDLVCPACMSTQIKKETDTLDVWFDSGVSHFAVVRSWPELSYPADVYLEGVDQHRGWFQSSLLTSMALENRACMRSIVTHGFTVDAQGKKMSKSVGNVVSPDEIIKKIGTDGLRLWASSIDVEGDAVVSEVLLAHVHEVYRKIRNTCRFLLSNLYDFDIETDAVALAQMRPFDRYALYQLLETEEAIRRAYDQIEFTTVFHELGDYCSAQLSSFYLDIIKDRLYTDDPTGLSRRSAQTACWYILDTITRLIAPVLSFTAESIADHYQKNKTDSIHLQKFADMRAIREQLLTTLSGNTLSQEQLALPFSSLATVASFARWQAGWEALKNTRSALLKAIEGLRAQGIIKHSLEARVHILVNMKDTNMTPIKDLERELTASGQTLQELLKELLIVSQVAYDEIGQDGEEEDEYEDEDEEEYEDDEAEEYQLSSMEGLHVYVDKAVGDKCPRCWQWEATNHEFRLCKRCQEVVMRLRTHK